MTDASPFDSRNVQPENAQHAHGSLNQPPAAGPHLARRGSAPNAALVLASAWLVCSLVVGLYLTISSFAIANNDIGVSGTPLTGHQFYGGDATRASRTRRLTPQTQSRRCRNSMRRTPGLSVGSRPASPSGSVSSSSALGSSTSTPCSADERRPPPSSMVRWSAAARIAVATRLQSGALHEGLSWWTVLVTSGRRPDVGSGRAQPAATVAAVKKSVGIGCSSSHVMAMGRSPACDTYSAGPRKRYGDVPYSSFSCSRTNSKTLLVPLR